MLPALTAAISGVSPFLSWILINCDTSFLFKSDDTIVFTLELTEKSRAK